MEHTKMLSIVIPAHNEEKNILQVLNELHDTLTAERIPYEIVVVNDNSSDGTEAVVRSFVRKNPRIRIVNRSMPNGFGRAIRSGLEVATGDVVVIYMADCSDAPEDVITYYKKILEGYDCVFGSRFIKGSKVTNYPPVKLVFNRITNRVIQFLFWRPFNDLTNAFKAYRREVILECGPYKSCHFNITIEMSLGALIRNYHICQVPISWTGRTWGSSKLSLKSMGRRYINTLIKIWAEKTLISDDLMAEKLRSRVEREDRLSELERRVAALEKEAAGRRVKHLQEHRVDESEEGMR